MKKDISKKLQIFVFIFYLFLSIIVCSVILLYSDFDPKNLSSKDYLYYYYKVLEVHFIKNYLLFTIIFFLIGNIYLFFLGFPLPLIIITSLIYGPDLGSIIGIMFLSLSSFCIYLTYDKFFFKKLVLKKISSSKKNYLDLIKKNKIKSIILFRLVGSAGIPFSIQNLILCNLKLSKKIFFLGTFFGMLPGTILTNYIIHFTFNFFL